MAGVAVVVARLTTIAKINPPLQSPLPTETGPLNPNIDGAPGMINTKLVTWALGIFLAISFVLCVIYGLLTPQTLHMHTLLESVLPAFKWLSWWTFVLGLVESFLWGAYIGLVFCPVYNWLYLRFGSSRISK